MRISATDIDDGLNGTVQYGLERHPQSPGDLEYFDIVPKNGEVRLKAPIPEVYKYHKKRKIFSFYFTTQKITCHCLFERCHSYV